jgi:preprotein translocase subunit SecG
MVTLIQRSSSSSLTACMDSNLRQRGLANRRGARTKNQRKTSAVAIAVVFLSLVVILAVATIRPNVVGTPGGIRRHDNEQHEGQAIKRKLHLQGAHFRGNSVSSSDEEEGPAAQDDEMKIRAPQDNSYEHNYSHQSTAEETVAQPIPVEEALPAEPEQSEEVFKKAVEPEVPLKLGTNFCEVGKRAGQLYSTADPNPAVIVLGMEDTSTDLVWSVLSSLMRPTKANTPRKLATKIDYQALSHLDEKKQKIFWNKVSAQSHGRWLPQALCQQQQHAVPIGFPWVVENDNLFSSMTKDALQQVKAFPEGSVHIIRVRRNYLDTFARKGQLDHFKSYAGERFSLDTHKLLSKLRRIQLDQEGIDRWLNQNKIPHTIMDFEDLFPFDNWKDMVQAGLEARQAPSPLNGEGRSMLSTTMERVWADLLDTLKVEHRLTMSDVLRVALQTSSVHTFWNQEETLQNFNYIKTILKGTKFHEALRAPIRHDAEVGWDEV